jgi:hypothetical protein
MIFEFAQLERRAAETAELLTQAFRGEWLFFRRDERDAGIQLRHMPVIIARDEREGFSNQAVNFQMQRALKAYLVALKSLAQAFSSSGSFGLPQVVAHVDAAKIDVAVTEAEFVARGAWGGARFRISDFGFRIS